MRLADLPRIIQQPHKFSVKQPNSVETFFRLVNQALFDTVNLKLYVSGTQELDVPLTPDYLEIVVAPYLKALESLLQIINEIKGGSLNPVAIQGITKRSPNSKLRCWRGASHPNNSRNNSSLASKKR